MKTNLMSLLFTALIFTATGSTVLASDSNDGVLLAMTNKNPCVLNPCAKNPCAKNPCAKNPCAKNPCAKNPCAKNPCAKNPCAKNPCAKNPCAKNPCAKNPCVKNPCVKNPCVKNPCVKNPCAKNPCAKNPCAKNPCGGKQSFRKKRINNEAAAIRLGEKLWKSEKLGNSGLSCNSCHEGGEQLNLEKVGPFPHYVEMPNDVVTLDQMINYCMEIPMEAKPLPWKSDKMTALAAYYQHLVKKHKGMKNPCSMKNPCGSR